MSGLGPCDELVRSCLYAFFLPSFLSFLLPFDAARCVASGYRIETKGWVTERASGRVGSQARRQAGSQAGRQAGRRPVKAGNRTLP